MALTEHRHQLGCKIRGALYFWKASGWTFFFFFSSFLLWVYIFTGTPHPPITLSLPPSLPHSFCPLQALRPAPWNLRLYLARHWEEWINKAARQCGLTGVHSQSELAGQRGGESDVYWGPWSLLAWIQRRFAGAGATPPPVCRIWR